MWLSDRDSDKIWLQATDLIIFSSDRKGGGGSGLGLIMKNIYNTTTIAQGELHTFQFAKWKTRIDHNTLTIVGVYRPSSDSNLDFWGNLQNG